MEIRLFRFDGIIIICIISQPMTIVVVYLLSAVKTWAVFDVPVSARDLFTLPAAIFEKRFGADIG